MPNACSSLFDDPDEVLRHGSPDKRVDMLRRLTDLFLSEADRLNDEQIGLFDGALLLINKIEAKLGAQRLLRFWQVRHIGAKTAS
jgi:hypothetical protein